MNTVSKKILTGSMAASLLLGGGLIAGDIDVHAQTASGSSTSAQAQDQHKKPFFGERRGFGDGARGGFAFGMAGDPQTLAQILGVTADELQSQLKDGKSLADIAQAQGISEDDLLQKLEEAENSRIDAAVSAGKMTQEQADKMKSGLADRLKKEVENTHPLKPFRGGPGGGARGGFAFGMTGDPQELAQILGITADELQSQLKDGKSLADIAQAQGISEDDLIGKIKDSMTDRIKAMVERKGTFGAKKQHATDDQPSASAQ